MTNDSFKTMFDEYENLSKVVDELESNFLKEKKKLSDLAAAIFIAAGRGPHIMGGKQVFIYNKGETWFFGAQRGRGKKADKICLKGDK